MRIASTVIAAVVWAGFFAIIVRVVAERYGYPAPWVATANVWVALLTLPSLIAVGAQSTPSQRTPWFFWLVFALAPTQALALLTILAWP